MSGVTNRLAVAVALFVGFSTIAGAAGLKQQDPSSANASLRKQQEAMRAAIVRNWLPSLRYKGRIIVKLHLNRDGTLDGPPQMASPPSDDPNYQVAAASVLRAVTRAQPFTMLDSASYESWKEMEIEFAPE